MANINKQNIDIAAFEDACGFGIVITPEMIETEVTGAITNVKDELLDKRYRFNTGLLMANVRKSLKWADGKAVKSEIDIQVLDLLGPKTDADRVIPSKQEKKSGKDKPSKDTKKVKADQSIHTEAVNGQNDDDGATTIAELMKTKVHFHKPGENYKTDGYIIEGICAKFYMLLLQFYS